MSSSGKGQSLVKNQAEMESAWSYAQKGARGQGGEVIIEEFVNFDYEITLLTVRHCQGTLFCAPIGHRQVKGDYQESWQPHPMPEAVLRQAETIAKTITDELGGYGLFGVEFFIKGTDIYFSEVSPRPHDTGLVTLISQSLSEFDLHLRALLGLPITSLRQWGPAASHVILGKGESSAMQYKQLEHAFALPDTSLFLFGKPQVQGERRLGVALALGKDVEEARAKALEVSQWVVVGL